MSSPKQSGEEIQEEPTSATVEESPSKTKPVEEAPSVEDPASTAAAACSSSSNQDQDDVLTLEQVLEQVADDEINEAEEFFESRESDKMCTYDEGYRARQALYACTTCSKQSGQPVGICFGCSYQCHDGHDMVQLYTKRRFRCDCGNARCPTELKCTFCPTKRLNEDNKYNQNFDGLYCVCKRPYPDENEDPTDSMIQCCVCEDWFHTRHISPDGNIVPFKESSTIEMTCAGCLQQKPFLIDYTRQLSIPIAQLRETATVDVEKTDQKDGAVGEDNKATTPITDDGCKLIQHQKQSVGDQGEPNENQAPTVHAVFWSIGWRDKLCRCESCKKMYENLDCDYLLDPEDPVDVYENRKDEKETSGGASGGKKSDKILNLMEQAGMDTVTQKEMLHEFNSLKEDLGTYLRELGTNGSVVTVEHVNKFFEERRAKRPRLDYDNMPPDNCRQ